MANFTPEEIQEILDIFFDSFAHRQYIGQRYVPIFGRKNEQSIDWDNTAPYEPLTIVLYEGNSFTSRQYVPAGVSIDNEAYWAETGNYNAQIEQYRQEVLALSETVGTLEGTVETLVENAGVNDLLFNLERNAAHKYITLTHEFDVDYPTGYYANGCTYANGYLFMFLAPTTDGNREYPAIIKVDASDGTLVNTYYFNENPNTGHGNSINYDPVTEEIVIYSSNRYITRMSTELAFISQEIATECYYVGQFAINESYLVTNLWRTNMYVFYKRIDDHLFVSYGMKEIVQPAGVLTNRQDMCCYDGCCYTLTGSAYTKNPIITMFGFNGMFISNFSAPIDDIEFEGICVSNSKMYVIGDGCEVYSVPLNDVNTGSVNLKTTSAVDMVPYFDTYNNTSAAFDTYSDDYVRLITVDASAAGDSSFTQKFQMRYLNFLNPFGKKYLDTTTGVGYCMGNLVTNNFYMNSSENPRVWFDWCGITVLIEFTKETNGKYFYMSKIYLDDGTNDFHVNLNDTDSDETLATKLRTLYTNSAIHLPNSSRIGQLTVWLYRFHCRPLGYISGGKAMPWQYI